MSVMVRHDATLGVKVTSDGRVLEERSILASGLDGYLVLVGYMYNALTVSGGVAWRDMSGRPISKPKVTYWLDNPERDALAPGQLCPCDRCMKEDA